MSEVSEAGDGKVGPGDILEGRLTDDVGQALAAHFRILGHGNPFAFDEERIGAMKTSGDGDLAVFKLDALPVAFRVGGVNFLDASYNFV